MVYFRHIAVFLIVASLSPPPRVRAGDEDRPPEVRLHLKDGAKFSGVPVTNAVVVVTSYARIAVPFTDIKTITSGPDGQISVVFPNGDILRGTSSVENIRFKTSFGTIGIGLAHIRALSVPSNTRLPEWINEELMAYYPLDGNADDAGPRRCHGSVHGAEPATDRFNNTKRAYRIQDKNFIMLNHESVNGLRDFTISVWVYLDKLNTGSGNPGNVIISVANQNSPNEFVLAHGIGGAHLGMNLKGDRYGWYEFKNSELEALKWYHVVVTRRRSGVALYINGGEVDSTVARPDPILADQTGVVLGQDQDTVGGGFQTYQNLSGKIDDLRIYALALPAAKVQKLHEAEGREY